MKLLVAVMGSVARPYPRLVRTIKQTWASVPVAGVTTLFYYGGDRLRLQGRDLTLPVDDYLWSTGAKTIAFFEWALANVEFDLLFRTNCSSYVDLENLYALARERSSPEGYYAGALGELAGAPFASGSGYFLSPDLMRLAAAERERWDPRFLDDVALGRVLHAHGVEPTALPRYECEATPPVDVVDVSAFHFRCKTRTIGRYGDVRIMLRLHRAFLAARGRRVPGRLRAHEAALAVAEPLLRVPLRVRDRARSLLESRRAGRRG